MSGRRDAGVGAARGVDVTMTTKAPLPGTAHLRRQHKCREVLKKKIRVDEPSDVIVGRCLLEAPARTLVERLSSAIARVGPSATPRPAVTLAIRHRSPAAGRRSAVTGRWSLVAGGRFRVVSQLPTTANTRTATDEVGKRSTWTSR